ncbi:MAG: hypothetical protein P8X62_10030 [Flavobacteriaceae bacterium]
MSRIIKNVIVLLFFTIYYNLNSQSIITDRPDQTESSSTIEKGSLQIETGILVGFTNNNDFSEEQLLAPTTLFRCGISKGFEISLILLFQQDPKGLQMTDLEQ